MSALFARGSPLYAIIFGGEIHRLTEEQILHDWETKIYLIIQVHFKNPAVARKITGMLLEQRGLRPLLKQTVKDAYDFMNPSRSNTNTTAALERRIARFTEAMDEAGEELLRSRARPYVVPAANGTLRLRTNFYNEGVPSARRRNTVRAPRTTSPPSPVSPPRTTAPLSPAKTPLESATNTFSAAVRAHGPTSEQAIRARVELAKKVIDEAQARGDGQLLKEARTLLSSSASEAFRAHGASNPLTVWATIQYALILHSIYDDIGAAFKAASMAYKWSEAGLPADQPLRRSVFKIYADLLMEHGLATNNEKQLAEAQTLYRRYGVRYKLSSAEFKDIKDHLAALAHELAAMKN